MEQSLFKQNKIIYEFEWTRIDYEIVVNTDARWGNPIAYRLKSQFILIDANFIDRPKKVIKMH